MFIACYIMYVARDIAHVIVIIGRRMRDELGMGGKWKMKKKKLHLYLFVDGNSLTCHGKNRVN